MSHPMTMPTVGDCKSVKKLKVCWWFLKILEWGSVVTANNEAFQKPC
jgi:hypothetical protein